MFTTLLLATNGWHHDWGPGPWVIAFPLLVVVAIVVAFRWGRPHRGRPNGMAVLAERFARGEIDEGEYRARLAVLRERRR